MQVDAVESNSPQPLAPVEPSRWFLRAVAATTFLGAFLLFQVQPLIGDVILPWFGGTPAVWTTAMLFFQAMLVLGYAFVYLTTRYCPPSVRSYLYLASAAICVAALPILPGTSWKPTPQTDPTSGVLILLFACVGAPYFLLSTTGPATQEWFARAYGNRSPYRLYSLSNLGSLLGLLTYPLVVQPTMDLSTQSQVWSAGFGVYAVLVGFCAWSVRGYADVPYVAPVPKHSRGKGNAAAAAVSLPATTRSRLREAGAWLALSAGGSMILLIITNHLCQDISSFPLLRIAPLVVYLITFIICFDRPDWYYRKSLAVAALVVVPLACWPVLEDPTVEFLRPRFVRVAIVNLALVFVGCMLCHGELAARKPEPQRLTFYYLMIAVGGAIGGLLVGIVAPLIYNKYWEWVFLSPALFLVAVIVLADGWTKAGYLNGSRQKVVGLIALYACCVVGMDLVRSFVFDSLPPLGGFDFEKWLLTTFSGYGTWVVATLTLLLLIAVVLTISWIRRRFVDGAWPTAVLLIVMSLGLWIIVLNHTNDTNKTEPIASARNFFGVVQVSGIYKNDSDDLKVALMYSGSTQHGYQVFDDVDTPAKMSRRPTTYYGQDSGIGKLLNSRDPAKPMRVGVVGLGVGTLATYAKKNDAYYFYEINPIVVEFANKYFTFLKDCEGQQTVLLGDARLTLENEPPQGFDVLVLDAFSSDAIPTHLLTSEAMAIYLRHLNADGVLAVHVSNRYLDLPVVMAAAAKQFGMKGLVVINRTDRLSFQLTARWVLMTKNTESAIWKRLPKAGTIDLELLDVIKPWTDQHCNFWEVLE